jgi:hypothetical protein
MAKMKIDRKHHKIIRDTQAWGEYEYKYHERHQQKRKAKKVATRHGK